MRCTWLPRGTATQTVPSSPSAPYGAPPAQFLREAGGGSLPTPSLALRLASAAWRLASSSASCSGVSLQLH